MKTKRSAGVSRVNENCTVYPGPTGNWTGKFLNQQPALALLLRSSHSNENSLQFGNKTQLSDYVTCNCFVLTDCS